MYSNIIFGFTVFDSDSFFKILKLFLYLIVIVSKLFHSNITSECLILDELAENINSEFISSFEYRLTLQSDDLIIIELLVVALPLNSYIDTLRNPDTSHSIFNSVSFGSSKISKLDIIPKYPIMAMIPINIIPIIIFLINIAVVLTSVQRFDNRCYALSFILRNVYP